MKRYQQGMTIWGWLMVLGLIGFFSMLVLTLLPVYMENMSVKKAVSQVASAPNAASLREKDLFAQMSKQFYIDEVHSVEEDDVSVEVDENDGTKSVVVYYEVRKPIMFNVDAVVWFEERHVLGNEE